MTCEMKIKNKEINTIEKLIVIKIDKMTAANLCESLYDVLERAKKNGKDYDTSMNVEMIKKFLKALKTQKDLINKNNEYTNIYENDIPDSQKEYENDIPYSRKINNL